MRFKKIKKGFSLMEVLVSVSILSILMMALIQSQLDMTNIVSKTSKLDQVESHVNNELLKMERNLGQITISKSEGVFESDHRLAGYTWQLVVEDDQMFDLIQVRKVTYRVGWEKDGEKRFYESFMLLDPGLNQNLQLNLDDQFSI